MDSTDKSIWQHIVNYLSLAVVVIGSIGNVTAFIVCSRSKLQKTFFHTYFRFRILIDTLNMFNAFNRFIITEFDFWVERVSNDLCRLIYILSYVTASSAWIDVCISMDRWISIKFPSRFMFRKKRFFQMTVCFGFLAKDFLLYSQFYFSYVDFSNSNNSNKSSVINKLCFTNKMDIVDLIDFLNAVVIPFILTFWFSVLIIKLIHDSKRNSGNH
jgi:hypothetical protein